MINNNKIYLFDLTLAISNSIDLIKLNLYNHHKRVAYFSLGLAQELKLEKREIEEIVLAALIHDCGAFSTQERLELMKFETENSYKHAFLGYNLLKKFKPFNNISQIIKYHHLPWNNGEGNFYNNQKVPIGSHILHLADRIDASINKQEEILKQTKDIINKIKNFSGNVFMPELIDTFMKLSSKECFWLYSNNTCLDSFLYNYIRLQTLELNIENLIEISKIFSHIIDFKSRFTAVHSSGVSATAEKLSEFFGFSVIESKMMSVAGYLHDLGKLAIPTQILEKPSNLTYEEFNIIKSHTFYTYIILDKIEGFENINKWASLHHERLNGSGYPFHINGDNLIIGSRIMAVADVFTALTENRPYRNKMSKDNIIKILKEMANNSSLDHNIVSILEKNYDEISSICLKAQEEALKEYQHIENFE